MKIHHIAFWVKDIEKMKAFYTKYFNCTAGPEYTNPKNSFNSFFLSFMDGTQIELMNNPSILDSLHSIHNQYMGLNHMAVSAGSKDAVDQLTGRLEKDGFQVLSGPRETGDGYYESVILDPENNRIEITI
jgi:lactoylglutathione lyase